MSPSTTWSALLLSLVICMLGTTPATAQDTAGTTPLHLARSEHEFGVGLMMNYPFDSFGDEYDTGWGLHGMLDYPFVPLVHFIADLGWNHFSGNQFREELNVLEITFGAKFQFGAFFMGGETGYYSKVDEWSFVPSLGLRFSRFELAMRIKAVGGSSWNGLRAGFYF